MSAGVCPASGAGTSSTNTARQHGTLSASEACGRGVVVHARMPACHTEVGMNEQDPMAPPSEQPARHLCQRKPRPRCLLLQRAVRRRSWVRVTVQSIRHGLCVMSTSSVTSTPSICDGEVGQPQPPQIPASEREIRESGAFGLAIQCCCQYDVHWWAWWMWDRPSMPRAHHDGCAAVAVCRACAFVCHASIEWRLLSLSMHDPHHEGSAPSTRARTT